jgi:hypothetical protein
MSKLLSTIAAASAAANEELSVFFAKLRTSGIFGKRERESDGQREDPAATHQRTKDG